MSTGIEWTDETWNPVVGCDRVSPGCAHCYAKELHDKRHRAFLAGKQVAPQYAAPFETVQLIYERLERPLSWRRPRRVFVNSVSDLFHEHVPDAFIDAVFITMLRAEQHIFQVLTKRPERMLAYSRGRLLGLPLPNVWLGVSVENQRWADERIPQLLETPAAVRFLSCEPLLGPLDLELDTGRAIDWVIVGGESGKGARPCNVDDLTDIVAQCDLADVSCFVKQLGSQPVVADLTHWRSGITLLPDASGYAVHLRDGHGGDPAEWPEELRVREFPTSGVRA
jgi:protein gp37